MKNKFLLLAGLALLAGSLTHIPKALAYSSAVGVDPDNSGVGDGKSSNLDGDVETKAIKKSATATASEALSSGLVVMYDTTALDGYTVTRAVSQTAAGQNTLACAVTDTVATGDTGYHRCITKGFVRVRYNVNSIYPIVQGRAACVNASGEVRGCVLGAEEATRNTGIIPLENKTGTGTDLRVLLELQ